MHNRMGLLGACFASAAHNLGKIIKMDVIIPELLGEMEPQFAIHIGYKYFASMVANFHSDCKF